MVMTGNGDTSRPNWNGEAEQEREAAQKSAPGQNSAYAIVRYLPKWKDQILDLQTHLWDPNRRLNAAYFEWKYERNPYGQGQEPLIYMAVFEGLVVAMRGFWVTE